MDIIIERIDMRSSSKELNVCLYKTLILLGDIVKIYRVIFRKPLFKKSDLIVVDFTGGLGAQIISSSIYFNLKKMGHKIYADLKYFNTQSKIAALGVKEPSIWPWQMKEFGIVPNCFEIIDNEFKVKPIIKIRDGKLKLELAINALSCNEIKNKFKLPIPNDLKLYGESTNSIENNCRYMCIHVRRGDYVNVATHLVSDNEFIGIAGRFSNVVNRLIVVSDSELNDEFKASVRKIFDHVEIFDGSKLPASLVHRIMSNSAVLVCSNSQFSLTAGLINNGLVIVPKKWFGSGANDINPILDKISNFNIIS